MVLPEGQDGGHPDWHGRDVPDSGMRVRAYLSGNTVHDKVITAFAQGCDAEIVAGWKYEPSEVAVVFGVYKSRVPASFPRGQIIAQQRSKNKAVIVLETGYLNRGDGENHHYAAGWNGLNGRADFNNLDSPQDRADKLGVELKPYTTGEDILLCGQVPWDASVEHSDHIAWLHETAKKLKRITKRTVVFRPHPLALLPPIDGCGYSTGPLEHELPFAHCVVTYNSNSGVDALIAGKPVYAADKGSMVWHSCMRDIHDVDDPWNPDRRQWLNDLAYCQWNLEEMKSGEAWRHLSR